MTDYQLLTLCISFTIPAAAVIYSNSRITDAKETLRAEMRAQFAELRAEMKAGFDRIETALKIHELEHHSK